MSASPKAAYAERNRAKTNYACMCKTVVDLLKRVLWDVLTNHIKPPGIPKLISTNKTKLEELSIELLTKFSKINPSVPEMTDFDVSSLYILICACGVLKPPKKGWGHVPGHWDVSLSADVERVREIRDRLYGYLTMSQMDDIKFRLDYEYVMSFLERFDKYFKDKGINTSYVLELESIKKSGLTLEEQSKYTERLRLMHDSEVARRLTIQKVKADVKSTKHQLTRQENRCSPSRLQVNGLAANLDTERGLKGQSSVSPVNNVILGLKEEARKSIPKASSVPENLGLAAEHGELLGRGACGEVYKWYDSKSGTMMAVKKVPLYGSTIERGIAESLVNEIKILKKLNHARIIRYYRCSEEETWIQIFMEYMPNGSLKDFMSKYHTPLDGEFSVKVTRQILEGIAYLHENKILHRDIKASNVLLDSEMNAKLADFGISKELHTLTNSSTHCNTHVGTPYWMSPERVRGEKYGRSADIWSIGCTVVEMITMKPPWYEFETNAAIFQIGLGVYPKYKLPSTVSPHVADLLSQTFQQEASKRPTALELLNHPFLR
ncbi:hypothetical protein ACJMK2_022262 [Sinanodonta woodiana]|uniref:Protein kinase domain-containing protein n=1 Tax=Sinanodonta woodiana TaxID=1069815 RepID=A0ABD3TJP2_SINWO